MDKELKIGDKVSFNEVDFYEITNIIVEKIPTRRRGEIVFTKLYFGDKHQPMYKHNVKAVLPDTAS
jgi:hypothetical protein